MSNFRYRGRSRRGDLITGRLEADDMDGIAARLLNLGITPLEIAPDAAHGITVREFLQRLGAGRPSAADLVLFSRQCTRSPRRDCRCCADCAAWPNPRTTRCSRCLHDVC